ncbi:levansucrase, partial [Pseudomonas syringae pv. actinidiae ICMP 18886]|uniref:glycoside hydrolase family 68 protein n=1 Tax=Pseudomonas syringae TaxID=317 RepID=UPI000358322F
FQDGKYYLFTISHKFTYAEGLTGPDGVYGFVGEHLFGPYRPMNASGLVLGNPPEQPFQTYSHCVMPGEDYRIGGTEAPTVRILLKGDRSFVQEEYDYGYIPAMKDVTLS